jgi:AAA+ ATPase superfamily predicted ATPase
MFVNRVVEREELKRQLDSDNFEFIILYGRRRVGKTTLVLESIRKREHIYYLAVEKNNLKHFISTASLKIPEILKLKEDWEVILDYLKDKTEVIVLDEFQNLIKEDKSLLSVFQRAIDTNLKRSKSKLIILGSSVSMMTSEVLDYKSPLYGRKTYTNKIRPLSFFDISGFFKNAEIEELAQIYGFAGGTPYYLENIELPFWKWLDQELQHPSFVKDELNFILRYEFEDLGTYKTILEAIANGKTTVKEIKDYAGLKRTDISPYLIKLNKTEFVEREVPITERLISKKGRYFIRDQFVAFWFKFIYSNRSMVEEGIYRAKDVKHQYNNHMGFVFEKICMQYLMKMIEKGQIKYNKIGRWWHRDKEIDILGLNSEKSEVLFCECKWKENVDAQSVLRSLKEKAEYVEWHKGRKERFAIFAKSFRKKESIDDTMLIDLGDFKKFL